VELVALRLEVLLLATPRGEAPTVDLCRQLRSLGHRGTIVFFAAELDIEHVRRAFEAGCDDYFVEPLRSGALLARLAILAQRPSTAAPALHDVAVGPLRIDGYDRVVVGAQRHKLPSKELALLRRLASTPDEVVTHDELTAAAWGAERLGSNALEVHVSRLRRWLERTLGQGVLEIRAVRRAGYLLTTKQPSSSAPS
jgi:DNA-binding response OmpR family regulator